MWIVRSRSVLVVAGALSVMAGACGGWGGDGVEGDAPETSAPAPSGAALTDAEIAHIAVTANAIDIELAELARSRASDAAVRQFAETMITDHTAVNQQAAALAERVGVTPQENGVSADLQAGAAEARTRLEGLGGAAFDRAYMEREVGYHQAVLDALDQNLIPGASNAELRALLEQVRPAIVAHLESARSIQGTVAQGQ